MEKEEKSLMEEKGPPPLTASDDKDAWAWEKGVKLYKKGEMPSQERKLSTPSPKGRGKSPEGGREGTFAAPRRGVEKDPSVWVEHALFFHQEKGKGVGRTTGGKKKGGLYQQARFDKIEKRVAYPSP